MPCTRSPGITVNAAGERIVDKEHRGVRIYARLGLVSEEEAQQRLAAEMERVEAELVVSNYSIENAFTQLGDRSSSANRLVAHAS